MKAYPKMLYPHQTIDKSKRIVKDALEEEKFTGIKMNEDGTPFEPFDPTAPPKPPTLQQVLRSGSYSPIEASDIVTREVLRAKLGFKPYGDRENPAVGDWATLVGGAMEKITAIKADGSAVYVEGSNVAIGIEELVFTPQSQVEPPSFIPDLPEEDE